MFGQRRIIIADRSELAGNLYGLLFEPLHATLVVRKRFQEARPHFFRREAISLGIFSSNIFGKKFEEIYRHIADAEPLLVVPKIFLVRDTPSERQYADRLKKLAKSMIVMRPFHPNEFYGLIERLLA